MEARKNNAVLVMDAFARAIQHQDKQRENVKAAFNDVKHDVYKIFQADFVKVTKEINQSIERTKEETCTQLEKLMDSDNTECE